MFQNPFPGATRRLAVLFVAAAGFYYWFGAYAWATGQGAPQYFFGAPAGAGRAELKIVQPAIPPSCAEPLNPPYRIETHWKDTALTGPVAVFPTGQAATLLSSVEQIKLDHPEILAVMILEPSADDVQLLRASEQTTQHQFIFGPVAVTWQVPLLNLEERFKLPGVHGKLVDWNYELRWPLRPDTLAVETRQSVLTQEQVDSFYRGLYKTWVVESHGRAGVDNMGPNFWNEVIEAGRAQGREYYFFEYWGYKNKTDDRAQAKVLLGAAIAEVGDDFIKVHKLAIDTSTPDLRKASLSKINFEAINSLGQALNKDRGPRPQISVLRYGTDPASYYSELAAPTLYAQKTQFLCDVSFQWGEWDASQTRAFFLIRPTFADHLITFKFLDTSNVPTRDVVPLEFGRHAKGTLFRAPRGSAELQKVEWVWSK